MAKLTPAQYKTLSHFTWNPYVSEWGGWYSEDHRLMGTEFAKPQMLRRLKADGLIDRIKTDGFLHLTITPAGIAAYDEYAVKRGEMTFDLAKETAEAQRAQLDR